MIWRVPFLLLCGLLVLGAQADDQNWMSGVGDETWISALTLPGTHDAGARYEPLKGTSQTQTATISEQLAFGVRLLDIRCRHIEDAFHIYHGMVNQKLTFAQVLKEVTAFLQANPSECVVMSINRAFVSKKNTREFFQTLESYIVKNPGSWYVKNRVPKLKEVRGRIVLFRRFSAPKELGLDASHWPKSLFRENGLVVQDCFQVTDPERKWEQIKTAFAEAQAETDPTIIHLNFTSGRIIRRFGRPDILAVSGVINPRLLDYFRERPVGYHGWLMMDFATAELSRVIYQTNFRSQR